MSTPYRFHCERCGHKYDPRVDCTQCDSGRCECGDELHALSLRQVVVFPALCGLFALAAIYLLWLAYSAIGGAP